MNRKSIRRPMLGAAYYPEAWDESEQSHDISMMQKAGITVVRIGEFAWSKMEPREGEYDFSWLHRCVDRLEEAGIRVILGTPSACPPIWLSEGYEIYPENIDGRISSPGSRQQRCYSSPDYLRFSYRIVEEMAKHFAGNPHVVAWQIDNELCGEMKKCYCPVAAPNSAIG